MFVYVLELLNRVGDQAFFDLRMGGRKANNTHHEKKCLAWKRRRAAKRERDCKAAKAAKLPKPEQSCSQCGRGFKSCKTARKHKCPVSKVESVREEAAVVPAAQVAPSALPNKPAAPITPHAPTAPTNSIPLPEVTGDSRDPFTHMRVRMRSDLAYAAVVGRNLRLVGEGRSVSDLEW
jgi:hypothetical protein